MRILVIHTWGIGDFIMFTPALQNLRKIYPKARIDAAVLQTGCLAFAKPLFDYVVLIDNSLKVSFELRRRHYDMSFVTSGTNPWKASLFSFMCGAKVRVGEYRKHKMLFYAEQNKVRPGLHRVERNLAVVGNVGDVEHFPTTVEFEKDDAFVDAILPGTKDDEILFGVHPGCNQANRYRLWSIDKFVELCNRLSMKFRIIIFAGPDEVDLGEELHQRVPRSLLVTGCSLEQTMSVIEKCKYFLTSDSGLGHVADALGVQTFVIFGPADYRQTRPYNKGIVIRKKMDCMPCLHTRGPCYELTCLRSLDVGTVYDKIMECIDGE